MSTVPDGGVGSAPPSPPAAPAAPEPPSPRPDDAAPQEPAQPPASDDAGHPSREAARYRSQLREREAELQDARQQLGAARAEIARAAVTGYAVAGSGRFNVEAFDDAGLDLSALFDAAGRLDAGALGRAMEQLATAKPYMFEPLRGNVAPKEGGATGTQPRKDWVGAFGPQHD